MASLKRRSGGPLDEEPADEESDHEAGFGTGVHITDSQREEIVQRIADGESYRHIGTAMGIGRKGVAKCALLRPRLLYLSSALFVAI